MRTEHLDVGRASPVKDRRVCQIRADGDDLDARVCKPVDDGLDEGTGAGGQEQ